MGKQHKDHPEHYGIHKVDGKQDNIFSLQFQDREFNLYCPLCGEWLHAFHLGGDNKEDTCCLSCKIGVSISAAKEGRETLTLTIDNGSDWKFEGTSGSKHV